MDNFETESNCSCSYHSESLQSNASTVSGLSLYGNEFAELRHLVNPSKYPQPYLEKSVTPKEVELPTSEGDKVKALRNDLQSSLELNDKFKLELSNLEKKIDLKFCDTINKLLRTNSRLEGELENANNQIDRLIKGYKQEHNCKVCKENVDLEKKLHQLNLDYSRLQANYAKLQQDKTEIDLENKTLKISLEEVLVERDIRNSSVQSLKQKVSEQHIKIHEFIKNISHLNEKLNLTSTKLAESDKSTQWYKEQLSVCQSDKVKLNEELTKCRNQISNDNDKILNFNIELSKCKSEVDKARLRALKEKEELLKKLDTINLDCVNLKCFSEQCDKSHVDNRQFHEQIEDLEAEISKLSKINLNKSAEIEKLSHENSRVISNCLVLQSTLKQKEDCIHSLETSRKELVQSVEYLKENEQHKAKEILQLKNKVAELEVELKARNKEKEDVEGSIRLIRERFLKVKGSYEQVTSELNSKNKEIVKLQLEKQELFMENSRITCELDSFKHKSSLIENLRRENECLISSMETLKEKLSRKDETNKEKENQEDLVTKYDDEIRHLQDKLDGACKHFELQLNNKDSKIDELVKTVVEQQKKLEIIFSEEHKSESDSKGKCIANLQNRLGQFETDYLKRITDDQKVELLLSGHKKPHEAPDMMKNIENYIMNFFDNLNVEEFENSVDARLNYLDDRVRKINGTVTYLEGKRGRNKIGELNILLQVKERELQERQKKMDRNNRTLLRKIKEHMRGRNSAEKQLKHLQGLYDTLKNSKEHEIRSLTEIENLRETVVNLEQKQETEKLNEALEAENKSLQQQVSTLLNENAKLGGLERKISTQLELIKNLENSLLAKEDLCCQQCELIEKLSGDLMEAAKKSEVLSNEVQIQSSNLQRKVEYSQELEEKVRKLEEQHSENDAKYNKTICLLQNDIKMLKKETFFLQRLTNDLKVVMNIYMERNKKLKLQLNLFSKEKQAASDGLPADIISIAGKYDENYINKLLNDSRFPSVRNSVTMEIQDCLNKLREEIFSLHDQMCEKNGVERG